MEFRLATIEDLDEIKEMYREIIRETERLGRPIWGSDYPVDFLHVDVESNRMFILVDGNEIVAAVALCDAIWDDSMVDYEDPEAKAKYIERLAVRPSRWREGLSRTIMEKAEETARNMGAEYLRLYVIESNKPASSLYRKIGFHQIGAEYAIPVDEHFTLHTNVMEKRIK